MGMKEYYVTAYRKIRRLLVLQKAHESSSFCNSILMHCRASRKLGGACHGGLGVNIDLRVIPTGKA